MIKDDDVGDDDDGDQYANGKVWVEWSVSRSAFLHGVLRGRFIPLRNRRRCLGFMRVDSNVF